MRYVKNLLIRCLQHAGGSTAIEFGVVVPVLIFIICAEFSFGMAIFEASTLQGALTTAARQGATGYPDAKDTGSTSGTRWAYITTNILYAQSSALLDKTKIRLTVTSYANFSDAVNKRNGTPNSLGTGGQVVIYTATYPFIPMPLVKTIFGNSSTITANAIVKNEPF